MPAVDPAVKSLFRSEELGIVLANLQLAEDRIPSFLCTFGSTSTSTGSNSKQQQQQLKPPVTSYVRDSVIYFDAELTVARLAKQRRRWLNGTTAAYLYLLRHLGLGEECCWCCWYWCCCCRCCCCRCLSPPRAAVLRSEHSWFGCKLPVCALLLLHVAQVKG